MTSLTDSAINVIVQNPDSNSWTKIIIPVFVSAILTSFIGYWVATKREKVILKQKLETETVDELLKLIWVAENDLNRIITTYYILHFSQYDEQAKIHENSIINKEPITDIDFQFYRLDELKTSIDNDINELINLVSKYHYSALEVIHYIESRKIILDGFKIFIDEIISRHERQRKEMDILTEKTYRFYLKNKIIRNEKLSLSDFDLLKECFDNLNNTNDYLKCYYYDLEIELQNEVIGKLYNKKINGRTPLDPKYKVLKRNIEIKW